MFIVKPKTPEDMVHALFILSFYKVRFEAMSDGDNSNSVTLKVANQYRKGDLRMAEMAFQMGFHQEGRVCEYCEAKGKEFCGHLTFTHVIKGGF
jgi:hypothetical protein